MIPHLAGRGGRGAVLEAALIGTGLTGCTEAPLRARLSVDPGERRHVLAVTAKSR